MPSVHSVQLQVYVAQLRLFVCKNVRVFIVLSQGIRSAFFQVISGPDNAVCLRS